MRNTTTQPQWTIDRTEELVRIGPPGQVVRYWMDPHEARPLAAMIVAVADEVSYGPDENEKET
jgi:hypothetical protein